MIRFQNFVAAASFTAPNEFLYRALAAACPHQYPALLTDFLITLSNSQAQQIAQRLILSWQIASQQANNKPALQHMRNASIQSIQTRKMGTRQIQPWKQIHPRRIQHDPFEPSFTSETSSIKHYENSSVQHKGVRIAEPNYGRQDVRNHNKMGKRGILRESKERDGDHETQALRDQLKEKLGLI